MVYIQNWLRKYSRSTLTNMELPHAESCESPQSLLGIDGNDKSFAWRATSSSRNDNSSTTEGYSSVEGARKLLNDMIYKSMGKYDAEILQAR